MHQTSLTDNFGRSINYVRLSVTDRCDFRCLYCMDEKMVFLPREEVLTLEEFKLIGTAFCELGVKKIRITGGEPFVRRNVISLFEHLNMLECLDDLSVTTNGSQLSKYAPLLFKNGVRRINISLDTLDAQKFETLTRTGHLDTVLEGIQAAKLAGIKVKLNSVILRNKNLDEVHNLCMFALKNQFDISFIEEMPLGEVYSHSRSDEHVSSHELKTHLEQFFTLSLSTKKTGGPSKYWKINSSSSHVGFISPHSENFCETCNRVRVTAKGRLLLCLGHEHSVDLRHVLRNNDEPLEPLKHTIIRALKIKPHKHEFDLNNKPDIIRFMNMTGG